MRVEVVAHEHEHDGEAERAGEHGDHEGEEDPQVVAEAVEVVEVGGESGVVECGYGVENAMP